MATVRRTHELAGRDVRRLRVVTKRPPDPGPELVMEDTPGRPVQLEPREALARIWTYLANKDPDFLRRGGR